MSESNSGATGGGIGLGSVIAVCCSWSVNHSIGYAFVHGICGWFYVLYWALSY